MLCKMKEILDDAQKKGYGVAYFNATDYHMVRAYIKAAEALRSPVIIGTSQGLVEQYGGFEWIAPVLLQAANIASVPVAVHLDHTYSEETIMSALNFGFGSVMFDGSSLSYEENIEISSRVSKIAHQMGAHVEFELGSVGGLEAEDGTVDEIKYTDPMVAAEFLERTDCDFLAVSIGTVHGTYKSEPNLNLSLLREIRNKVSCPLVLHGGSGLSNEDFRNTISGGISKINVIRILFMPVPIVFEHRNVKFTQIFSCKLKVQCVERPWIR